MSRVTALGQREGAGVLGRARCACQQIKSLLWFIHGFKYLLERWPPLGLGGEKTDRQRVDKNNEAGTLTAGRARPR